MFQVFQQKGAGLACLDQEVLRRRTGVKPSREPTGPGAGTEIEVGEGPLPQGGDLFSAQRLRRHRHSASGLVHDLNARVDQTQLKRFAPKRCPHPGDGHVERGEVGVHFPYKI